MKNLCFTKKLAEKRRKYVQNCCFVLTKPPSRDKILTAGEKRRKFSDTRSVVYRSYGYMIKRVSSCLLAVCLAVLLCACSMSRSEAAAYVKGTLDSFYLNQSSEDYLEMIGSTTEECEEDYRQYVLNEVDYFKSYMDISEVSDETQQRIVNIIETLYKNCRYEVGEVAKSSDRFLVSVTVYPVDVISRALEDGIAEFERSYTDNASRGMYDNMSDSELEELWAQGIISEVEAKMANIGYLDPVTISVQVVEDEDGYYISDDDLVRMDELVIEY